MVRDLLHIELGLLEQGLVLDSFKAGDRVEFRPAYASSHTEKKGQRGTVVTDAPMSVVTGVLVRWDTGEERVSPCFEARKLTVLEKLAEI